MLNDVSVQIVAYLVIIALTMTARALQPLIQRSATILWRRIYSSATVAHFWQLAYWRRAVFVLWVLAVIGSFSAAFVMRDAAPLSLQGWMAFTLVSAMAYSAWLSLRGATRQIRRLWA